MVLGQGPLRLEGKRAEKSNFIPKSLSLELIYSSSQVFKLVELQSNFWLPQPPATISAPSMTPIFIYTSIFFTGLVAIVNHPRVVTANSVSKSTFQLVPLVCTFGNYTSSTVCMREGKGRCL